MSRKQVAWRMLAMATMVACASATQAAVSLPNVISGGMVIQRDRPAPIWGKADAGEQVTVTFAGQSVSTTADANGKWRVNLPASPANATPQPLVVAGTNTITLDDILVGDVWLCGGQSNMAWTIARSDGAADAAKLPAMPTLRIFQVAKVAADAPADNVDGQWQVASGDSIKEFSAVGFYFGRELTNDLNIPIGLINASWGGTAAEAWMSEPALVGNADLQSVRDFDANLEARKERDRTKYDADRAKYEVDLKAWRDGGEQGTRPAVVRLPPSLNSAKRLHKLYNGMIAPIAPYGIKGAIWYQGEANGTRGLEYRKLLPAMIANWRETFETPELPFGIVQLANFQAARTEPHGALGWTELREAQLLTQQNDPHAGLVVTIDVGNPRDIHPTDKQTVASRLARWAKAKVYGQQVEFSGPAYRSMSVDGSRVRVTFDHADGIAGKDGATIEGFELAGADQKFVPAQATIEGGNVVLTAPGVEAPVAVRYAWAKDPKATLVNGEGLPASPFRTDDWALPIVNPRSAN